jgi:hypothetical protein
MRGLFKPFRTWTTACLDLLQLMLQLPVARCEQFDLTLLPDYDIIELGQRTLEMCQLDFDLIQAGRLTHGGVQAVDTRIYRAAVPGVGSREGRGPAGLRKL